MSKSPSRKPTPEQFAALQALFDYFNKALFADELAPTLLTIHRHSRALGSYAPDRWISPEGESTHEIALDAAHLATGTLEDVVSTVVHEMVHHWQRTFGTPGRRGYHNGEWANKMESLGLMPSHSGKPGGRRVGEQMDHYILPHGPYVRAFAAMPPECRLPWQSREIRTIAAPTAKGSATAMTASSAVRTTNRNKVGYKCPTPTCDTKVWGKPGLNLKCGDCDELLQAASGLQASTRSTAVALGLH